MAIAKNPTTNMNNNNIDEDPNNNNISNYNTMISSSTTVVAVTGTETANNNDIREHDGHEDDMVMPGFRFHPTEEELVEFYLRRKVEGKRFNVELITFLDLYRYDPWELPAMASIGEKEWFFYVPRDRKYRNGDRPNRVTTSGYWKATGADRMIRTENARSIGLKKTLVFYSGKAPKGIRTSWIMNEYRLPQHETEKYQKAEISLCRVYKRAGVDDHHTSIPRSLQTTRGNSSSSSSSSSRGTHKRNPPQSHHQQAMERLQGFGLQQNIQSQQQQLEIEKVSTNIDHHQNDGNNSGGGGGGGSSSDVTIALGLYRPTMPPPPISPSTIIGLPSRIEEEVVQSLTPTNFLQIPGSSTNNPVIDDLQRLINYQQLSINQQQQQFYNIHQSNPLQYPSFPPQTQAALALNMLPSSVPMSATVYSDRFWEWNPIPEANKESNNNPFKEGQLVKGNLCLYGLKNESWEVKLPVEEVPSDLPEPTLGINFARDGHGMVQKAWLSLVAIHSDSWLLAVAFCVTVLVMDFARMTAYDRSIAFL
ncbi:hypothetical protein ACFE04_023864 [Oxalis oulophora]